MRKLVPVIGNQLVSLVVGLVGFKLFTRFVDPSVNGLYQVHFLSLCQLGTLLTHPGLINHASRYWIRERSTGREYLSFLWAESWRRFWLLSAICCVALIPLIRGFERFEFVQLWFLSSLCAVLLALLAGVTLVVNAEERHWTVFGINATAGLSRSLFPIGLSLLMGGNLVWLCIGFSLHCLATFLAGGLGIRRVLRSLPRRDSAKMEEWRKELVTYGRPFIVLGAGNWLLQFADRWLVSLFTDEASAGVFSMAGNLSAYVPNVVIGAMMQFYFPRIFRAADKAESITDWREIAIQCDKLTVLFIGLSLGGIGLLWCMGPWLAGWLIDGKYVSTLGMLIPAGIASITLQVNQFQFLLLQGQGNSAAMAKVLICVAFVKTFGSVLSLVVSWNCFLFWLCISMPFCAVMGRSLIRRVAFSAEAPKKI